MFGFGSLLVILLASQGCFATGEITFVNVNGMDMNASSACEDTGFFFPNYGAFNEGFAKAIRKAGAGEVWTGAYRVENPRMDDRGGPDLWQFPDGYPPRQINPVRGYRRAEDHDCLTFNVNYKGHPYFIPARCDQELPVACYLAEPTILVAVAGYDSGYFNDTDTIPLIEEDVGGNCLDVPNYVYHMDGPTTFTVNSVLYTCGGYEDIIYEDYIDECYFFDPRVSETEWQRVANDMNTPRGYYDSVTVEGGTKALLIGGYDEDYLALVEEFDGVDFLPLFNLTIPTEGPCAVALPNGDEVFVAGGSSDDDITNDTGYVYNWRTGKLLREVPLIYSYSFMPACGLIKNPDGRREILITADCYTEAISISNWGTREVASSTSTCEDSLVGVEHGDTMLVIGVGDTILEFDTANYEWIERSETTKYELGYRSATLVSPSLLKC